ncbi:MAG: ribonuclease E/G [Clostridia bacterium]|nr:ribonuclease E/G [Clostridia bacterium]
MEEIIIQIMDNNLFIIVLENGKIVEYYEYDIDLLPKIDNVYKGRIKDILWNTNTIFVDYGAEKTGYLQLKEMTDEYRVGDDILVQIKKDAYGTKGAKLTNSLSLAGRNVVLFQDKNVFAISKKNKDQIDDTSVLEKYKKYNDMGYGIVLRTDSLGVPDEIIYRQIESLIDTLKKIENDYESCESCELLYDANDISRRIFTDFCKSKTYKIYVNNKKLYDLFLKESENQKNIYSTIPEIVFSNNMDFISEFGLETEKERILDKKVWLKSGGYIITEKTQALTTIDVNSGKYASESKDNNFRTFVLKINKEAAIEAAKQIRLKNIGGMIIIDFINMQNEDDKEEVKETFCKEARKDRAKMEVFDFTKLGLLELTRKKL